MSRFEIKMPKLGESITEGIIIVWNVKAGDTIKEDDVLLEVNTAKVSAEIPSPVDGKIVEILFKEGDVVPVGTVIAIVELEGSGSDEPAEEKKTPETKENAEKPSAAVEPVISKETPKVEVAEPPASSIPEKPVESKPAENKPAESKPAENKGELWYSPAVLHLAQEAKIAQSELEKIPGTGYQGRVSKKDIDKYIEQAKKVVGEIAPGQTAPGEIAPAAEVPVAKTVPEEQPAVAAKTTAPVSDGNDVVKDMDYVRKLIADHMVMSKKVSPHVTTVLEADVTKLARWRDQVKEEFFRREGVKLTFMPAFAEATAKALLDFPQVNVSVDGYRIIFKKQINIGIAVSLNDGNLIVPVIHDADKVNLNGLAVSIDQLAKKARNNKLTSSDVQGGTFTITNLGSNGSLFGTPIINQPEVAILGVGLVEKRPSVVEAPDGDMIAIRNKVYLSLSYDHRVIDGALGGSFLRRIADYLENWNIFDKQ